MRQRKQPTKHFKRLLHFENGDVWSWRLKRITDHDGMLTFEGIQIRNPSGKDALADSRDFVRKIEYDRYDYVCDGPGMCELCTEPLHNSAYQPSIIKRYIQTVLIEGQTWEPNYDRS
jgi:hypothetical protein